MTSRHTLEITSGVFIILAILALFYVATRATDYEKTGADTYTVSARFGNIGDLKSGAPVSIAGVRVGRVAKVELDPVSFEAIVTLRLDGGYEVPADTAASVLTSGVLGDQYIGLEPGGDPTPLAQGDEIFITESAIVLEQLISRYLFDSGSGD
jgi:phospholipid/cholesterol/gamma-HCH transport system substrate-binding protein